MDGLARAIRLARISGRQTLYAEASQLTAEIALDGRAIYLWTRHPAQRRKDLQGALEMVSGYTARRQPWTNFQPGQSWRSCFSEHG
jgi:hypothetical protein